MLNFEKNLDRSGSIPDEPPLLLWTQQQWTTETEEFNFNNFNEHSNNLFTSYTQKQFRVTNKNLYLWQSLMRGVSRSPQEFDIQQKCLSTQYPCHNPECLIRNLEWKSWMLCCLALDKLLRNLVKSLKLSLWTDDLVLPIYILRWYFQNVPTCSSVLSRHQDASILL